MTTRLHLYPILALKDNYIWCLHDDTSAIVVDPGDATPVFDFLHTHGLILRGLLITHHHHDHTGGIEELYHSIPVSVYGPSHTVHKQMIAGITHPVSDNDEIYLDCFNTSFKIMTIPGHTLDHIAYYDDQSIFCGDTLFASGCGRVFEGTTEQMLHSLQRINDLKATCKIYCAHEYTEKNLYFAREVEPDNDAIQRRLEKVQQLRQTDQVTLPSNLEIERETNPFLRCHVDSVIAAAENYCGRKLDSNVAVFKIIRQWKDSF